MSKLQKKAIQSAIKKAGKKSDSPLFGQIIKLIPRHLLIKCVDIYQSDKHCSAYKTYDQLVSLLFGQLNLNIKYGKQTLALIAQAATHQLKNKLPDNYNHWTAAHTAQQVLTNMEGDLRVEDDTIIVTYYRDHEKLNLRHNFENISQILQSEGVNPKIPWLFDFKLDFRFK